MRHILATIFRPRDRSRDELMRTVRIHSQRASVAAQRLTATIDEMLERNDFLTERGRHAKRPDKQ